MNKVVVQHIRIIWTKDSRGMPQAQIRSLLPRKLLIGHDVKDKYNYCLYRMLEEKHFSCQATSIIHQDFIPLLAGNCLRLREESGQLILGVLADELGQPYRYPRAEAIRLQPEQYAQLCINHRYTSYSGQYYSEDIYNVAYGAKIRNDIFLSKSAIKSFALMADLF